MATWSLLMDLRGLLTPYLSRLSSLLGFRPEQIMQSLLLVVFTVTLALSLPTLAWVDPAPWKPPARRRPRAPMFTNSDGKIFAITHKEGRLAG